MPLCPHKGRRHAHWHTELVQKTGNKTKINLQQCKSNIYLCKRENLFLVNWGADLQLFYVSSRQLKQFVLPENLVHNSIFIFLPPQRFTYIHVPFRESFIVIIGEKPKRDLYKYTSKTYRIWIRSFPWVISGMQLAGNPIEFKGLDTILNEIPEECHKMEKSWCYYLLFRFLFVYFQQQDVVLIPSIIRCNNI